jgi:hypothetical protein
MVQATCLIYVVFRGQPLDKIESCFHALKRHQLIAYSVLEDRQIRRVRVVLVVVVKFSSILSRSGTRKEASHY